MPSRINGVNLTDLVRKEVEKSVQLQTNELTEMKSIMQAELDTAHQLLLGALARISCLERELQKFQPTNTSTSLCCPLHRKGAEAPAVTGSKIGAHMVMIANFPMKMREKVWAVSNLPSQTWKISMTQTRSRRLSRPRP